MEWVRPRDTPYVSEPLEIDGKVVRGAREYAVWDVVLSCGHFTQEHTEPGWKPEDGPVHRKNTERLPLNQVLEEIAKGGPNEESYWRRMYAEHHPDPAPFTRCHTCARIRTIAAYQRVGWLAKKAEPVEPTAHPAQDPPTALTEAGIRSRKTATTAGQPAFRRVTKPESTDKPMPIRVSK